MSVRASSMFAAALGHAGYAAALFVIGFGVFAGLCAATAMPLIAAISAFNLGASSPAVGLATFFGWLAVSLFLTFRCRHWIVRKAIEEAPPKAVKLWSLSEITAGGFWIARAVLVIPITLVATAVALAVVALAIYAAYLLIGSLSVPVAIIIAAIIIAVAILIAVSS